MTGKKQPQARIIITALNKFLGEIPLLDWQGDFFMKKMTLRQNSPKLLQFTTWINQKHTTVVLSF